MKTLFTLLIRAVKLTLIVVAIIHGVLKFDISVGVFGQSIAFWLLVLIPAAMGYESIIAIAYKVFSKKNTNESN